MPPAKAAPTSEDNHGLLIELRGTVGGLSDIVNTFVRTQTEENRRIHARIDDQNTNTAKSVDAIKDSLAARGRLNPTLLCSALATLISFAALTFGMGHSYVNMRLESIKPQLDATSFAIQRVEAERARLQSDVQAAQVQAARVEGQHTADLRWLEKLTLAKHGTPPQNGGE